MLQVSAPGMGKYDCDLARLKDFTGAVALHCRGSELEAAIESCDSVRAAAEGLEAGMDCNTSMHLLGHAALNLNQIFAPKKTTGQHLDAIDATVAMINARNQPALAS
jgi:hypothetical protein